MTEYEDDDSFARRSARIERRDEAGAIGGSTASGPTDEQKARAAEMRNLKASRRLLDEGSDD